MSRLLERQLWTEQLRFTKFQLPRLSLRLLIRRKLDMINSTRHFFLFKQAGKNWRTACNETADPPVIRKRQIHQ